MKDYKFEFEVDTQKYTLVFNLNVMETIQAKYGSVQKWWRLTDRKNGEPNEKALIFGFTEMINEAIDMENEENNSDKPRHRNELSAFCARCVWWQHPEKDN